MIKRKTWGLIGFGVLMVVSALYSSWHRPLVVAEELPLQESSAPVSGFSPRQRPLSGHNIARELNDALGDAVEKVMPSVVVVRTEKTQVVLKVVQRDLFGFLQEYRRVPEQLAGEGSGVIIDEQGHVITSYHVVEGVEWIEVVLNDGTKLPAKEVGHDKATDLAVLKIQDESTVFPAVEFGDSDALRIGEFVIAIGSPFSLQGSVTVGHVSQKGRRMQVLPYEDFIQTDVAINEGNSGGALIDVDGRLVGINAAILTEAQEKGIGIAFAVPSNLAGVIANSLIEKGKHEWPWVGASFGTHGAGGETLLQVAQIWRDTPAAKAGLLVGDRVLSVNGKPVKDEYDVYRIIFNHAVGDTVNFRIQQADRQRNVELSLQEFPGLTF
jgi:serine protease Do